MLDWFDLAVTYYSSGPVTSYQWSSPVTRTSHHWSSPVRTYHWSSSDGNLYLNSLIIFFVYIFFIHPLNCFPGPNMFGGSSDNHMFSNLNSGNIPGD